MGAVMNSARAAAAGLAMLLLPGAAPDDRRLPPRYPFRIWQPETSAERHLDSLITEVVDGLEKDGGTDFEEWRSRDIASEYRDLHMRMPPDYFGMYGEKNFISEDKDLGTYFYARLDRQDLRYFVPSACLKRVSAWRAPEGAPLFDLKVTNPGMPSFADFVPTSKEYLKAVGGLGPASYEFSCTDKVRIRLYDSRMTRCFEYYVKHGRSHSCKTDRDPDYIVGVAVFRKKSG